MAADLSFAIRSRDVGSVVSEIVPVIDGVELTDRIHRFEREAGFESREVSYGGLIPASFKFGPAEAHYHAAGGSFVEDGKIPLLGCVCGEWGCWPLLCRVVLDRGTVTWSAFEQPHRQRDYSGFGPFVFDRSQYEDAVGQIARWWESESS